MQLIVKKEVFPLKAPFKIAHGTRLDAEVILVAIKDGNICGFGEGSPYQRYNETCNSVIAQIEAIRHHIEAGIDNITLQKLLPNGAARNAIDCALWDLEAQKAQQEIWQIAKLPQPRSIQTVFTLVIDTAQNMANQAKEKAHDFASLKLKLAGDTQDAQRIMAIAQAAPNVNIVIDANESWSKQKYLELIDICQAAKVTMIEQPFKAGQDEILRNLPRPIAICADESCHIIADLENLQGKYDMVNIKLDKTGGFTHALQLITAAKKHNFKIMLGCMVATSTAIRFAYYLAHLADFVDIDAPLLLKKDRHNGLSYEGDKVTLNKK